MTSATIQTTNLTKTFPGGTVALSALDLSIEKGIVYGLMGRNGAGKTTTLRLLMGLLRPDSGTASVLGQDMREVDRSERARVGYVSQQHQLPGWLTLEEFFRYMSHFYDRWDGDFAAK